jgi:hypothetical protein
MTLDELGLNTSRLVAGFAGGVVHAFVFKQSTPLAVVGSVLTGTLTANYLAPAAVHYLGGWFGDGGTAFVVGLSAMAVCQGIVAAARSRVRGVAAPSSKDRES